MGERINFKVGEMNISADLDGAKFIIAEEIKAGHDMHKLNVDISDDVFMGRGRKRLFAVCTGYAYRLKKIKTFFCG